MLLIKKIKPVVSAIAVIAAASLLAPASLIAQDDVLADQAVTQAADISAVVTPVDNITVGTDGYPVLTKTEVESWLDGFMPYAIDDGGIVGAVVTVVKDGEILTSKGYGYADLETKTPVDPANTLFRPGSTSKLFTWTGIMQLVEQGKVDLDEDVNTYLDFKIPDAYGAPITVRHLLTHTAGFEEAVKRIILSDQDEFLSLEEYLKTSIPGRIFPPGTTPAYSNYATALAGYIVELVSGESFDDYIENHIFDPIGMTNSSFRQPLPDHLTNKMSGGYKNVADGKPQYFELITPAPAGSLSSTGEDMGRFMIAQLNQGEGLMSAQTTALMHGTYDQHTPPLNAMALGFYQQDHNGVRGIGHGGDTVHFHSELFLFPDRDVGLFVSVNSAGNSGGDTLKLRGALGVKFAERYFSEAASVEEPTTSTSAEHAALVAGVYESSRASMTNFMATTRYLGQMTVSVTENGELSFPFIDGAWRFREVDPFVWQRVNGPEKLAAVMNEDGTVHHFTFDPISPFTIYTPAPAYRSSAVLTPLLMLSLVVLAATLLLWPVRAIVRWRYKGAFPHSGQPAFSYRLVRVGIIGVFAYLAGWAMIFTTFMADLTALSSGLDGQLRMMQMGQFVLYAALALSLWNIVQVWSNGQSWFAKAWSTMLPVAIAVVIWFAAIAGWLSFKLVY